MIEMNFNLSITYSGNKIFFNDKSTMSNDLLKNIEMYISPILKQYLILLQLYQIRQKGMRKIYKTTKVHIYLTYL